MFFPLPPQKKDQTWVFFSRGFFCEKNLLGTWPNLVRDLVDLEGSGAQCGPGARGLGGKQNNEATTKEKTKKMRHLFFFGGCSVLIMELAFLVSICFKEELIISRSASLCDGNPYLVKKKSKHPT